MCRLKNVGALGLPLPGHVHVQPRSIYYYQLTYFIFLSPAKSGCSGPCISWTRATQEGRVFPVGQQWSSVQMLDLINMMMMIMRILVVGWSNKKAICVEKLLVAENRVISEKWASIECISQFRTSQLYFSTESGYRGWVIQEHHHHHHSPLRLREAILQKIPEFYEILS